MNDENKLGFSEFPAFNIALGKTLIAAAWVDGELNKHELLCLKNLSQLLVWKKTILFENEEITNHK